MKRKYVAVLLVLCTVCCAVPIGLAVDVDAADGLPGRIAQRVRGLVLPEAAGVLRERIQGWMPQGRADAVQEGEGVQAQPRAIDDWADYLHVLPIYPGTAFDAQPLPLPAQYDLVPLGGK